MAETTWVPFSESHQGGRVSVLTNPDSKAKKCVDDEDPDTDDCEKPCPTLDFLARTAELGFLTAFLQHILRHHSYEERNAQRNQDRVVKIADDWDKIGSQIDRAQGISNNDSCKQLG